MIVEHRRHSMRHKPGRHLSQEGVDLARRVGADLGPFDRVVTSTVPRAAETAVAMGFAVSDEVEALSSLPPGFEDEITWDAGFARMAAIVKRKPDGVVARFAGELAALLHALADRLAPDGRLLVVSHGGIVEASAVGCLPDHDLTTWDHACNYCEGVRLHLAGGEWHGIEVLRVR